MANKPISPQPATPRTYALKWLVIDNTRILLEFDDPDEARAAVAELRRQKVRIDHRILGTRSMWEILPEFAPEVLELLQATILPAGMRLRLEDLAAHEQRRRAA